MTAENSLNMREQQRLRTRAQILDAALSVFAEKGFDAASVRDISSSIGVNHGLIRHHFQNKDNLWKEAVAFLFERMEAEIAVDPEEEANFTELEKLEASIRRYVRYCARHPEHARMMVQQSIQGSERFTWMVKRFIGPQHERAGRHLTAHKRDGLWPNIDDFSIAYILVAAAQMPFVLADEAKAIYGIDVHDDSVVERHADAIIELFFHHRAGSAQDE